MGKKTGNQNLPRQVDSNGCSMFAGDIHGLATANACPETASQSYRRRCGQKEFVGVRWYNKYNIPPFTVTVCCFGVLVTLKSRAIGLFTFAKYGRCSCSFSKACTELYYVVLSCFIGKLLPFVMCFCCMLNAGPHWLHFMPPSPERLMLRSIFATWYFGLQNLLPTFTQENKVKYCKTLSISGDLLCFGLTDGSSLFQSVDLRLASWASFIPQWSRCAGAP